MTRMLDLDSEEFVAALNVENEHDMDMDEDFGTVIGRPSLIETQEDQRIQEQPIQTILDYAKRSLLPVFELWLKIMIRVYFFVGCLIIVLILVTLFLLLPQKIFLCMLALIPTVLGLLLIAQACNPRIELVQGILYGVVLLGMVCHRVIDFLLFIPIAFINVLRMLFNQAFNRGLQISRILGGQRNHHSDSATNKD